MGMLPKCVHLAGMCDLLKRQRMLERGQSFHGLNSVLILTVLHMCYASGMTMCTALIPTYTSCSFLSLWNS